MDVLEVLDFEATKIFFSRVSSLWVCCLVSVGWMFVPFLAVLVETSGTRSASLGTLWYPPPPPSGGAPACAPPPPRGLGLGML